MLRKIWNIFQENAIEKMIFLLFLEKLLLKIEPLKIATDFYKNFSYFGGGGVPLPPPPCRRLWNIPLITYFPFFSPFHSLFARFDSSVVFTNRLTGQWVTHEKSSSVEFLTPHLDFYQNVWKMGGKEKQGNIALCLKSLNDFQYFNFHKTFRIWSKIFKYFLKAYYLFDV